MPTFQIHSLGSLSTDKDIIRWKSFGEISIIYIKILII